MTGKATFPLHGAAQLTEPTGTHLKISWQADYPGTAYATEGQLTALQVGSITLPGP